MEFSLKKENRKKFQDKQKLKRSHLTKSDVKYIKQHKEEKKQLLELEKKQEEEKLQNGENVNEDGEQEEGGKEDEDGNVEGDGVDKRYSRRVIKSNTYRYDKEEEEVFHNRVNNIVDESYINDELRDSLKRIALEKNQELDAHKNESHDVAKVITNKNITKKDIDSLNTKQLNELLLKGTVSALNSGEISEEEDEEKVYTDDHKSTTSRLRNKTANQKLRNEKVEQHPSGARQNAQGNCDKPTKNELPPSSSPALPSSLQADQDFLDGFI